LIKACYQNNHTHVDELLEKDLPEAGNLFFNFGVHLLMLSKLLENISNDLVDKHCTCRNKEQSDLFGPAQKPPSEAIVYGVFNSFLHIWIEIRELFEILIDQCPR